LPRPYAEREAFEHVLIEYLNETAETESDRWRRALAEKVETVMTIRASQHRSDALRSLWPPRTPDATLLPIGWGERHAWLHSGCLDPWRTQRRLTAEEELARLGVVRS
jgi:hypothetical protein